MRLALGFFLACVFFLWGVFPRSVLAHPHVFISLSSDVVFGADKKLEAINVEWIFDKDYSDMALDGLDHDGDGNYSQDELLPLVKENIAALKEYRYFVYAQVEGVPVAWKPVEEYGLVLTATGQLKMYFQVRLQTPIDPLVKPFSYRIYDPSFYIAIDYPKDSVVSLLGSVPEGLEARIGPPPDPTQTQSVRDTLAEKDKQWSPDEGDDFGSLFAQTVTLQRVSPKK